VAVLPPEITVLDTPGQVIYRLPHPSSKSVPGRRQSMGIFLVLLVVGAVLVAWPLTRMLSAPGDLPPGGLEWLRLLLWPWGALVLVGLLLVLVALFPFLGCCEIGVEEERVWRRSRLGPIRLSSSQRPRNGVRKVMLVNYAQLLANATGQNVPPPALAVPNPDGLALECEGAGPLWLIAGYPQNWLLALAEELSRRCGVPVEEGAPSNSKLLSFTEKVLAAAQPSEKHDPRPAPTDADRLEQPRGSRIQFEQRPDGVTLMVPAEVLSKEDRKGCLTAGAFGCGGIALLSTVGLIRLIWFVPNPIRQPEELTAVVLPCVLLWLAAWAFYYFSRKARRPSTILATADDRLFVHRTRAFTVGEWEWKRDELKAIRVAFDESNGSSPDQELQIVPRRGGQVRLLTGVREEELNWVAAVLRQTLDVPESPPPTDPR
jgi:hypothetical protein